MPDVPNAAPDSGSEGEEGMRFEGLARYERHVELRQVSYYLSGTIELSHYYTDLYYALRTAGPSDMVYLHLNTPGGDFNTGLQIINNMQASEARVIAVLEARANSMGSFIFLAADDMVVHDNCQLMFHSYSGVLSGKGNEQQAQALAVANWFEKFMLRTCQPFLSLREIKSIVRCEDLWMDSDEIRHRLQRMRKSQQRAAAVHRVPPPPGAADASGVTAPPPSQAA